MDLYLHVGMFTRYWKRRIPLHSGGKMMELFLQFGFGMMEHCRHLISVWNGGTAILSPRDLTDKQLNNLASEIIKLENGKVLLDPQFYLPKADHERLCSHEYWPSEYDSGTFFQGKALAELMRKIVALNESLNCQEIILPGFLSNGIDDTWLESQRAFLDTGKEIAGSCPVYSTIALNDSTACDQDQIATLLDYASKWNPDGYYIVCEHPKGEYLVENPIWLANILDLTAGLKMLGAKVIIGYCNHQMLAANVARANAICSGTWMNVRSFPPIKFRANYDEEIRQRAIWYYCPQALSEYTIPFLDVASTQKILELMAPAAELDGGYSQHLFEGTRPTTIGFTEQLAFRHYLYALHGQVNSLDSSSYENACNAQNELLKGAESVLKTLSSVGVRGQGRDFLNSIDVNRSALALLDSTRGQILKRKWNELS